MREPMQIVILGLSITSSWGNGHATTFRGLVKALDARGHDVLFLERDMPWYASNRDLPEPPYGRTKLYASLAELRDRFTKQVRGADAVIVGSYVPDGTVVGEWVTRTARGVTAFYDIDTPVTLARLEARDCEYLSRELLPRYDVYLSFTGGPTLRHIEEHYGSPRARALYCSADPDVYYPQPGETRWDLGYLGTYAADRQPALERLLLQPARRWPEGRFSVAGPMYPDSVEWPANVERTEHLPPAEHRAWYNSQRATLNLTRRDMVRLGWSPSVRLFEAAACGTPIIGDRWPGLESLFRPGREILPADSAAEVLRVLRGTEPERLESIGAAARRRFLAEHTAAHRAEQLEEYLHERREAVPHLQPPAVNSARPGRYGS